MALPNCQEMIVSPSPVRPLRPLHVADACRWFGVPERALRFDQAKA